MRQSFLSAFAAILCTTLALPAVADPKPAGAKTPNLQEVANYYGGKTHLWKSCKGGIYYGPNWEAQAICPAKGEAIGLGKWRVDKRGRVCHDLTWYWPDGDGVGSKVDETDCINHVSDTEGKLWRNWPDDANWWRAGANSKNTIKGFKYKSKINRMRKKLKL